MVCRCNCVTTPDTATTATDWENCYGNLITQACPEKEGRNIMVRNQTNNKWNCQWQRCRCKRSGSKLPDNTKKQKAVDQMMKNGKKSEIAQDMQKTGNFAISEAECRKSDKSVLAPAYQNPGLLISIQSGYSSAVSSFQMLSDAFQESYTHCCMAFHISPSGRSTETTENSAAATYAILKLLFEVGYNTEKIAVSGLDTLMILAAKGATKLEDTCSAWKTIASLMQGSGQNISERIRAVLMKLKIDFQKTASLISVQGSPLPDSGTIALAILSDDKENRQFLNSRLEPYMVCGSTNYFSIKCIQTLQDFTQFFASQKNSALLEAWQKLLSQEKDAVKKKSRMSPENQFYPSGPPDCSTSEVSSIQINLKQENYLFAHAICNLNILSAATLLSKIHIALRRKWNVLEDVTFKFPMFFTPESEIIDLKVEISMKKCTLIHENRQCVTFKSKEPDPPKQPVMRRSNKLMDFINGGSNMLDSGSGDTITGGNADKVEALFVAEEEFYAQMEQFQYQYCGEFCSVRCLVVRGGKGIAQLKPSTCLDVLIDGAMQAIVFTYNQLCGIHPTTLVPFHIQKMEIVELTDCSNSVECSVSAYFQAELQNGQLLGSFEFITNKVAVAAQGISFYPMIFDKITKSLPKEMKITMNPGGPKRSYQEPFPKPGPEETTDEIVGPKKQQTFSGSTNSASRKEKLITIKSIACRLPTTIRDPAELWDALKAGRIMAGKIPCSRIEGRDRLAGGQYGHAVKCANFLAQDIAHFDAAFFGISRSEAEKMDPQQRLLLECVYECMENAGMTSLQHTGFFVGFMANEYPDIVKSRDVVSMLGSSASIISGRLNYVFGSTGPAMTLDTACSSSLVALQAAVHALLDGQCATAIVAGVNLILTEQSIGQRANGNLLAEDGMCRSFDASASGYGRSDGCVVLLLSSTDDAVSRPMGDQWGFCSTLRLTCNKSEEVRAVAIISNNIGHNGQSVSLTAPNGCSQGKLLKECLGKIPVSQSVDYWEAHGTGTIIGDAIELNALQANLQNCLISTAKTHFGHPEAAAGAVGLAKVLLQFRRNYIPEHGSYQFLKNFQNGSLCLPIVGEEWTGSLAGLSSFGISGTNAMTMLQSRTASVIPDWSERTNTPWKTYICPVSAKSMDSLRMLTKIYGKMLENTSQWVQDICSAASLQRNHMKYRAIILLQKGKIMQKELAGRRHKEQKLGLELSSISCLPFLFYLCTTFSKFKANFKSYFKLVKEFVKQQISTKLRRTRSIVILTGLTALVQFLYDLGIKLEAVYAHDNLSLTAALLSKGKLKFSGFQGTVLPMTLRDTPIFTQIAMTKNTLCGKRSDYKWLKFHATKGQGYFEYEMMTLVATTYLQEKDISWEFLYSPFHHQIALPNYQFKREAYWVTERPQTVDHWLLGRLVKDQKNEFIFENQISKMTNPLLVFRYDGQVRFSFGICCEAVIEAIRLTVLKGDTMGPRSYTFKNISMRKSPLKENTWITTTVTKEKDGKYRVRITCTSKVICEADIKLINHTVVRKGLNANKIEKLRIKPDFYEVLGAKGLFYPGSYHIVTFASPDVKVFAAKWFSNKFLIFETLIQVACYLGILKPQEIYSGNNFTIKNLDFCPLSAKFAYVMVKDSQVIVHNEVGLSMISASLKNEKLQGESSKKRHFEEKIKPKDLIKYRDNIYQEFIQKVKQAVEDIRNDSITLSNRQLSMPFAELGLDSLALTDLVNRLNSVYFPGLQAGVVDLFNYSTIYSLAEAIHTHKILTINNKEVKPRKKTKFLESASGTITGEKDGRRVKKNCQNRKKPETSAREKESCAYVQTFLEQPFRIRGMTIIITDREQKPANEFLIIVHKKTRGIVHGKDAGVLYLDTRNPEIFVDCFLSQLNGHKMITVKFELTSKFSLRDLTDVLLLLTNLINKSTRFTYFFSSKPGCGRANAFALGFAKSLSAELYPKVQYDWDFCLQKVPSLKGYLEVLPKLSRHLDVRYSKERWLITGGLGGIGWQMAKWILQNREVSYLILLGRRKPNDAQCREINKMRNKADVRAVSVDLTSRKQMKEFFEELQISLTGVIHSAGCIHDALATKQTVSTFRIATEAKCDGLLILEKECRSHPIQHFIVNSSVCALIGNRGQCNYSAANAYVDEFVLEKRAKGLPATIINWGNWLESGMAVAVSASLRNMGFIGLKTNTAMTYLQYAIDHKPPRIIVLRLNVQKIRRHRPDLTTVFPKNSTESNVAASRNHAAEVVIGQRKRRSDSQTTNQRSEKMLTKLNQGVKVNSDVQGNAILIKSVIIETLEEVTGEQVIPKDFRRSFMDLGLDSLRIYRFVNTLGEKIKTIPSLNILTIFENPTIEQLARYIESLSYQVQRHSAKSNTVMEKGKRKKSPKTTVINFSFFVLQAENLKKLRNERHQYLNLIEFSSRATETLKNQSRAYEQHNGFLSIIWGSRHKALKRSLLHSKAIPNFEQSRKRIICFMFSGQGSQAWNMGRQLSCVFPFFRRQFDQTLLVASKLMSPKSQSLQDVIHQWNHRQLLYKTEYAQPVIYCFAYSLAKLYESCGVKANFFVGHSVGELVAYTLADQISLNDALKVVVKRGQILASVEGKGKMIAAKQSDADVLQKCSGMSRAAVNSDKQIILSGDNKAAKRCLHLAREHQYPVTVIDNCYPFHSSVVDSSLVERYKTTCRSVISRKTGNKNVVSNCSGQILDKCTDLMAPIESTVLFKECIETLRKKSTDVWIEIGNGETLSTLVRSMFGPKEDVLICSALRNGKTEVDSFIDSLCQLQKFGVQVNWNQVSAGLMANRSRKLFRKSIGKGSVVEKENYEALINQHLINGQITVPAAMIIAMFAKFVLKMNMCELAWCEIPEKPLSKRNGTRISANHETVVLKKLLLERRLAGINPATLRLKKENYGLVLMDDVTRYCRCQLGKKEHEKALRSAKQIISLNHFRNHYGELKSEMNKVPHQRFYQTMRKHGLQYGPKYEMLREIHHMGRYIGATVISADNLIRIIDGALQVLSAALLSSTPSVFIPFLIDRILIRSSSETANNCFQVYGVIAERTDNFIRGSAVVCEGRDEIIILHNVTAIVTGINEVFWIKPSDPRSRADQHYPRSSTSIGTERLNTNDKRQKVRKQMTNDPSNCNKVIIKSRKDEYSPTRREVLEIEILSYAGLFPGSAIDCVSLWNNLKTGASYRELSNTQTFQRDVAAFNPTQFGITPKEAAYIDPQQRILLELAQKTVEKAGMKRLDSGTGVFIGVSSSDFAQKAYEEIQNTCSYLSTGTNHSALAGRIAHWLNLSGPAIVLDTACSSFLTALGTACDNIKLGNCPAALVGAVNVILNSKSTSVLEKAQMLSKTGNCKVFDMDADGYVRSEGAAMVLLQGIGKKGDSLKTGGSTNHDIRFTIEAYAIGHNGRSNGFTVPSGLHERELMSRVYRDSGARRLTWVEAHAAGTRLGDPIEMNSIAEALRNAPRCGNPVYVTSVKSSTGHCEAAASAVSLIMALQAFGNSYLPPMQHFKLLNKNVLKDTVLAASLVVPVIGAELPSNADILINSFGFSGTNASIVVKGRKKNQKHENAEMKFSRKYPRLPKLFIHSVQRAFRSLYILLCTGENSTAFEVMFGKLEDYLQKTDQSLAAVCASLQKFRNTGTCRSAVPIKRHTQNAILTRMNLAHSNPVQNSTGKNKSCMGKPEKPKGMRILFLLGVSTAEPAMIAELCTNYRLFQKIFVHYIKTYQCADSFASSNLRGKFAFEFITKLSLVTFLISVGIKPYAILARTNIDRIVAQVARRKFKTKCALETARSSTTIPYLCDDFKIQRNTFSKDFDCIFDVQELRIGKPGSLKSLKDLSSCNWKRSFSSQFTDTLCQLYGRFVDIDWEVLQGGIFGTCLLPDPVCSKKKYWPFADSNVKTNPKEAGVRKISFSNKKQDMPRETMESLETKIVERQPNSNIFDAAKPETEKCAIFAKAKPSLENDDVFDTTVSNPTCSHYMYKLIQKKCNLHDLQQITRFAAVNFSDSTTIVGQRANFTVKMDIDDDIFEIKEQLNLHKCRKLVLEWILDEENLIKNIICQSMLVIRLWMLLQMCHDINCDEAALKPCMIVFATNKLGSKVYSSQNLAPFSALLKTLAAESEDVNFKAILTDTTDQQLIREIFDESDLNETIYYINGNRYLERLQKLNHNEMIQEIPERGRILITGSATGIARELIKVLKPQLAVIVSRTAPNGNENHGWENVIKTVQADCTFYEQLEVIFATFAPFDFVFHCAAIVSNALMENMDPKLLETVLQPKVIGLLNIIKLSKTYPVRKIVAFSSAATILGSAGQANYAVANQIVEYLMQRYVSNGLTISWGPWSGCGLLAGEHMDDIRRQIQNSGWNLFRAKDVAQLCCRMLWRTGHYITLDANFEVLWKKRPYLRNFLECISENNSYRYGEEMNDINAQKDEYGVKGYDDLYTGPEGDQQKVVEREKAFVEREKAFEEIIKTCITEVSGIEDPKTDVGFMSMGIDSLMIIEMQKMLSKRLNLNITTGILYEYCTVDTLAKHAAQILPESTERSISVKKKDITGNDAITITGYSGAFSGAADDETFWYSLLEGKELIEPYSKAVSNDNEIIKAVGIAPHIDKFDYRFWRMNSGDASYIDPQTRKFVEHAYIALERSGLVRFRRKLRIAVIVGAEPSGYSPPSRSVGGIEDLYELNQKDFVAAWTSHLLDLRGPSFGVYSACSSALVAILQAINLLHNKQCDVALAGAVSLAIPEVIHSGSQQGLVFSTDGHCRPFDHRSNGTIRGSAVGVIVLRRLSEARKNNAPVIARITGYGISNDGLMKSSFMAPNITGQKDCIKDAIKMAGTAGVDYIECHGTGTTTGDLIELTAMSQFYHKDTLVGSVKANIGHALAGAGIAAIIKLCKIAETRMVPKQINFEKLNESLRDVSFTIPQSNLKLPEDRKSRLAVNACGIGGTNAHIILENEVFLQESSCKIGRNSGFHALTISARTEDSCIRLCQRIADYLKPEADLGRIASTLQNYREHFEYRTAVTSNTVTDAIKQIRNIRKIQKAEKLRPENIAFFFAPQGLEYADMGREEMAVNEVFREVIHKCCDVVTKLTGINFEEIMHPGQKLEDAQLKILEQPYSQLAIFIVCFAGAEQLRAWGIEACTMVGHSLGEYVAAAQADVFDVETALKILLQRGRLIAKTERAKMLAVKDFASVELLTAASEIQRYTGRVEVSAVLRQDLNCLVGKPSAIEDLKKELMAKGVHCTELFTNYGFHSSFMEPILNEFGDFLKNFSFRKPTKQILSNIDGHPIERFDSEYMVKHMRSTIRIDKCLEKLHDKIRAVVEIGPKGILESLLKDDSRKITVISTIPSKKRHEQQDSGNLLTVAAKLWTRGYDLNWETISGNSGFDRFLPNYQFEQDICWEHRKKEEDVERFEAKLYKPCWVLYSLNFRKRFPNGVLLLAPEISTKSVNKLLIALHNLFIPVKCVFRDTSSGKRPKNMEMRDDNIYINSSTELSYQEMANYLRDTNFKYDTIIHAWNTLTNQRTEWAGELPLLSSFFSIHWIATYIIQNANDIRFLVAIDQDVEPEMFTVLGPLRELVMTRRSIKAGCVICTPEVNLFEALQLLDSQQSDFSMMRNLATGRFEHISYQEIFIREHDRLNQNQEERLMNKNGCLVQNRDLVVIFGGFGSIGQSFINILCQSFRSLTVYVASPHAIQHYRKLQNKINQWEAMGRNGFLKEAARSFHPKEHAIHACDVDITNKNEVQHFLREIIAQHGCIDVIIHAAGKANIAKFQKRSDEMHSTLQPKVQGVRNIIDVVHRNDIKIRSLILNSSLNAVLGLPGGSDYAASNVFLDEVCLRHFCNIQNVTSIQWTGWKGSNMLEEYTESQNPITKLIARNSLPMPKAEQMIRKCLYEQGSIAVSTANPDEIIREIYKLTHNFKSMIPERGTSRNIQNTKNNLKSIVANIWMDCLGAEQINLQDDFFKLGGHSLNGVQIIWDINRALNITCKLDDLFSNPQFDNFLQHLQTLDIETNRQKTLQSLKNFGILDSRGNPKNVPLSYSQENMYILRQLQRPTLYNICFLITFHGSLCAKSLHKAILYLVAKQTSLRTAFPTSEIENQQEIYSLTESYHHISWSHKSELERKKLIDDEKNHIMDLRKIPFRIIAIGSTGRVISKEAEEMKYEILISQHHIITDGWSMTIFASELAQFYCYCMKNQHHQDHHNCSAIQYNASSGSEEQFASKKFKKLTCNVAHFAAWQRSEDFMRIMNNDLQQLCDKIDGIQATRIIAHKTKRVASKMFHQKTFPIPVPLWAQIKWKAKECQQTLYIVMLAAFVCLVREFSDDYSKETVLIGCPVSGRTAEEMQSVMGYFLNNIILIVRDLKTNAPSDGLLVKVAEAVQEARRFEHVPFHLLVAKLIHQRHPLHQHPVFDIFFNYRHDLDFPKIDIPGVRSTITQLTTNDAFDFSCTVDEIDQGALVTFGYNANMYHSQLIRNIFTEYLKLLKFITQNRHTRLSSNHSFISQNAVQSHVKGLQCRTNLDLPPKKSLISAINSQSVSTDKYIALHYSKRSVTYHEMRSMVYSFAAQIKQFYLQSNCEDIRADTIIPICADTNTIVVPLLAVLSTGAAYAPIDPRNSTAMISQLVYDTGASIVISQQAGLDLNIPTLSLAGFLYFSSTSNPKISPRNSESSDIFKKAWEEKYWKEEFGKEGFKQRSQDSDASYVIFTSGSTGKPKAVCVANQSLTNFVVSSTQQAALRLKLRVYHSVNTIFDVSCMNIFTTLSNGCCLVSAENILNASIEIAQKAVQFAFLPSALFNMFQSDEINELRQLEHLFVGGETPSSVQLNKCLKVGIRIQQIYGPTETTVWSLTNNCSLMEHECGRIIGKAIDNEIAYLLDPDNGITCDGGVGELVIWGDGVSRGYLHQERDTFVTKLFHVKKNEILNRNIYSYRTGDFAVKLGDKYFFLGRKDKQLKVRGFRVEPGEIEAVVRKWDSPIKNIAVMHNNKTDNLVLFVEKENSGCAALRAYLKDQLLQFMIPEQIIVMERIPLNRSGKIDVNKLREVMKNNECPRRKVSMVSENTQGREAVSGKVKEVWRQLLKVTQFEPDEDFFTLGGNSLLLVLLRNRLRENFGFELDFEHFYRCPTLAALIDNVFLNIHTRNGVMEKKPSPNEDSNRDSFTSVSIPSLFTSANDPLNFIVLRETVGAAGNLYMIHAIAGTVLSYFGIVPAIPEPLNIYAIEYELHYSSDSLIELASFYSKHIAKHSKMNAVYLMGHSLGGILVREVAQLLADENKEAPFVIMLDSWSVGNNNLRVHRIANYLQEKLEGLPDKEQYIKKSTELTKMLQKHQFSTNSIKIYLVKAKEIGNSALRTSLRGSRSADEVRALKTNGWQKISTKIMDVFLVNGDHDSILQQYNASSLTQIFGHIYAQNGLIVQQP